MAAFNVDSLTARPRGAEHSVGLWNLVWKMELFKVGPPMCPPVVPSSTLVTCPLLLNSSALTTKNCSRVVCVGELRAGLGRGLVLLEEKGQGEARGL